MILSSFLLIMSQTGTATSLNWLLLSTKSSRTVNPYVRSSFSTLVSAFLSTRKLSSKISTTAITMTSPCPSCGWTAFSSYCPLQHWRNQNSVNCRRYVSSGQPSQGTRLRQRTRHKVFRYSYCPSLLRFSTLNENPVDQAFKTTTTNTDIIDDDDDDTALKNHTSTTTNNNMKSTSMISSTPSPQMKSSPPWNNTSLVKERMSRRKCGNNNNNRFRQHVNPLASRYQQHAQLPSENWPESVFDVCHNKPLHIDIGSGKGGFLLELAKFEINQEGSQQHDDDEKKKKKNNNPGKAFAVPATALGTTTIISSSTATRSYNNKYNYLGLELRPLVAQFAKERIETHNLTGVVEFLGCNANVDLDRLLRLYHQSSLSSSLSLAELEQQQEPIRQPQRLLLERVTIQFPDPHFKIRHAKRRVVTEELVDTLAQYMPPTSNAMIFLQSDVQRVLDQMRIQFRKANKYFEDSLPTTMDYIPDNVLKVPTERETSVLNRTLPVYRCLFHRTEALHPKSFSFSQGS